MSEKPAQRLARVVDRDLEPHHHGKAPTMSELEQLKKRSRVALLKARADLERLSEPRPLDSGAQNGSAPADTATESA